VAYSGTIKGGTHEQRVVALAGALAECGITRLEAELSYCATIELEARVTDLPGFLRDKRGPILRTQGMTIAILADSIEWAAYDLKVKEAMLRAGASLG
jgi:hypothetical protein